MSNIIIMDVYLEDFLLNNLIVNEDNYCKNKITFNDIFNTDYIDPINSYVFHDHEDNSTNTIEQMDYIPKKKKKVEEEEEETGLFNIIFIKKKE